MAVIKLSQYVHRTGEVSWRDVPSRIRAMRQLTAAGREEALRQATEIGYVDLHDGPNKGYMLSPGKVSPNTGKVHDKSA